MNYQIRDIPDTLYAKLRIVAAMNGVSINKMINKIIKGYLNNENDTESN